jgi:hypothetical protein
MSDPQVLDGRGAATGFVARMIGASTLRAHVFEEIEADVSATWQAFFVVLLSALATGIGGLENSGWGGLLWQAVVALVGWWVWAWVTCWIGTRLLPVPETISDHGELLRVVGFSSAPGLLRVLMLVPVLAFPVLVLTTAWMLVAMVVGVRQALDYESTLRAIAVCLIGFPVYLAILVASIVALGPWPV